MDKINEFLELFKDERIVPELSKKTSPEEVKDFLDTIGLDYSLEEIKKVGNFISSKIDKQASRELSVDELAEVAGGTGSEPSLYFEDDTTIGDSSGGSGDQFDYNDYVGMAAWPWLK